jgi:hypothetical protein
MTAPRVVLGRFGQRPHIEIYAWEDEADGHLIRHRVLVEIRSGSEPLRVRIQRFSDDGTALDLRFDVADADRLTGFLQKGAA